MKRPYAFAPLALMLLDESKERQALLAFPPTLGTGRRSPLADPGRGRAGTRSMALRLQENARRYLRDLEAW